MLHQSHQHVRVGGTFYTDTWPKVLPNTDVCFWQMGITDKYEKYANEYVVSSNFRFAEYK